MSKMINSSELIEILSSRNLTSRHGSLADFPHFSLLADMDKATKRIAQAIDNKEKIVLVSDYDADGVCGCAIAVDFFSMIGYDLEYIIPDRFTDGYGISKKIIDRIDDDDVSLIFSIDNGIVAYEAADECKRRGIDLIITDHHTPGDKLPECYAVVNPHRKDCSYPFKDICGAQVAFLLCSSIKAELKADINMSQFLDILAIATIGDVMPLVDINRHIVIRGLSIMNTFKRKFFKDLAYILKKEYFRSEDIAFQIAPRINAAGRLENGRIAVEALLASGDSSFEAVSRLDRINTQRKDIQEAVLEEARAMIDDTSSFNVIVGEDLHEGIVGIVASKIAEETKKPTLILNRHEGVIKGSGRSVGSVNIYQIISDCSEYLTKFGGHAQACGLSLLEENFEAFSLKLQERASLIDSSELIDTSDVLGELDAHSISLETLDVLDRFSPFGEGNPYPCFECKEASVISVKSMGSEQNHTKLEIDYNGLTIGVPVFNTNSQEFSGVKKISFEYTLSLNEFRGNKSVNMMPKNISKL